MQRLLGEAAPSTDGSHEALATRKALSMAKKPNFCINCGRELLMNNNTPECPQGCPDRPVNRISGGRHRAKTPLRG